MLGDCHIRVYVGQLCLSEFPSGSPQMIPRRQLIVRYLSTSQSVLSDLGIYVVTIIVSNSSDLSYRDPAAEAMILALEFQK